VTRAGAVELEQEPGDAADLAPPAPW